MLGVSPMSTTGSRRISRQQPGFACEGKECRKRKLRCDRQRPACVNCIGTEIACKYIDKRAPRKPKENGATVVSLRSRVAALEQQAVHRNSDDHFPEEDPSPTWEDLEHLSGTTATPTVASGRGPGNSVSLPFLPTLLHATSSSLAPGSANGSSGDDASSTLLTDLVKADLIHIFFDRVHPTIPLLHKAAAIAWLSSSEPLDDYRQCLQYCIFSLAAVYSPFAPRSLQESLHRKARAKIEDLDLLSDDLNTCKIEHVQSWVLLAFYEFAASTYRQAWLSAGRAFRMVHLMMVHAVDAPSAIQNMYPTELLSEIQREEKRRVFWMAYCLDRLLSVCHNTSTTLSEFTVMNRLPCPESDFARGVIPQQTFLSEAMTATESLSAFPSGGLNAMTESIVILTISGRAHFHKQIAAVEVLYGGATAQAAQQFASTQAYLRSLLGKRMANLEKNFPPTPEDPLLTFCHLLGKATEMYLGYVALEDPLKEKTPGGSMRWGADEEGIISAGEMLRIAQEQGHLGYSKAHVFLPQVIYTASAKFTLFMQREIPKEEERQAREAWEGLHDSIKVLKEMSETHMLARYYIKELEQKVQVGMCPFTRN
ncbi:fungal-specific transcription factor domain-containing protein [Podospora australis]|uniref:Fungal-specific transcription factor domain-containing protein n=1 Tax=Podospora australis TaxID=1536484 RepID=A0AAN6WUG2_9PEZI|nr:fungal-specific transcription factor domain-containing protein [Podospora australis]